MRCKIIKRQPCNSFSSLINMVFGFFTKKQTEQHIEQDHPGPADSPSPEPDLVTDSSHLRSLLISVPPQTLHSYALSRLPASPTTLTTLTRFFNSLTPPPKLHCVRCHNPYFELENTDRSCRIAHDDDSTVVERVRTNSTLGGDYETLWGCCAKTVDGDGDQGPPDGWCYEGQHTTDPRRARFRADSSPSDDKLVPCEFLRCGQPPVPRSSSRTRKRSRRTMEDTDVDDPSSPPKGHRKSSSINSKLVDSEQELTDVQTDEEKPRPVKRPRSRKKSTVAMLVDEDSTQMVVDSPVASPQPQASSSSPPTSSRKGTGAVDTPTDSPTPSSITRKIKPRPARSKPKAVRDASGSPKPRTKPTPTHKSPLSSSFVVDDERSPSPVPKKKVTRQKSKNQVQVEIASPNKTSSTATASSSIIAKKLNDKKDAKTKVVKSRAKGKTKLVDSENESN